MDKNQNKKNDKKILISSIILGVILVIMVGISMYFVSKNQNQDDKTLAYTDLIKEISYGNV